MALEVIHDIFQAMGTVWLLTAGLGPIAQLLSVLFHFRTPWLLGLVAVGLCATVVHSLAEDEWKARKNKGPETDLSVVARIDDAALLLRCSCDPDHRRFAAMQHDMLCHYSMTRTAQTRSPRCTQARNAMPPLLLAVWLTDAELRQTRPRAGPRAAILPEHAVLLHAPRHESEIFNGRLRHAYCSACCVLWLIDGKPDG